jgi:Tfp pilus assembly protein PilN
MHAQTVYGIVPSENGRYVMVSLRQGKPDRARLSVRRWRIGDKLASFRLMRRGVYCGVRSFWKTEVAIADDIILVAGEHEGLTSWTDRLASAEHMEAFSDNLLGVVPEDSYLCTVPLFCGAPSLHSFISVHHLPTGEDRQAFFKIGVIRDKVLLAVFTLAPGTMDALEFHLERIRRFIARHRRQFDFPDQVYVMGASETLSFRQFQCRPLSVGIGNRLVTSGDELKALGCALARSTGSVPFFSGPSKASSFRHFRATLWIAAGAILLATALGALVPVFTNMALSRELHSCETRYRSLIINDPDIQTALKRNDSLAASIVRMNGESGRRTIWGRFLQALGAERPAGLFYEKLGSESVGPGSNAVRIAISGISQGETMVTDLISRLQKTGFISNVTLTFMEKDKTKPNLCDFKILCTLIITGP